MTRRFVVLDRDGTIIVEREYLSHPDGVELLPGAAAGLRDLRGAGFGLVVLTNQSGVSRGYYDLNCLDRIHQRMVDLLKAEGASVDGIYYCAHVPEAGCDCRKPRPGMLDRAAREHDFVPASAWVVGDKPCDVELGRGVGANSILVRTGSVPASSPSEVLSPISSWTD